MCVCVCFKVSAPSLRNRQRCSEVQSSQPNQVFKIEGWRDRLMAVGMEGEWRGRGGTDMGRDSAVIYSRLYLDKSTPLCH